MMLLGLLLSCAQEDCSSVITYETEGMGLMRTYCTSCHSQNLSGKKRYGAPQGMDFDTLSGIRTWAEESAEQIGEQGDMPPGGGIHQDERDALVNWLKCGSPGEELPPVEINEATYTDSSHNVLVMIETDPEFENTLLIRRTIDYGGSDLERVGPWTEELYQVNGSYAWLVAYSQYIDSQTRGRSVFFDPPLPILSPEEEWSIDLEMNIEEDGTWRSYSMHWDGVTQDAAPIDGQQREVEPRESIVYSEEGEEWGWQFSIDASISAQWVYLPDGMSWTTLQYAGDIVPGFSDDFPIKEGIMWLEHMVEE